MTHEPAVLLRLALASVLLTLLGACSIAAVDERMGYWRAEVAKGLPIGASQRQAEDFFAARGATLGCCVAAPPGPSAHFMLERRVGRGLVMEYDVAVVVEFDAKGAVVTVSVQRWGVGF